MIFSLARLLSGAWQPCPNRHADKKGVLGRFYSRLPFIFLTTISGSHGRPERERILDALSDVIAVEPQRTDLPSHTYQDSATNYSGQEPMATMDPHPAVPTKDTFDPVGKDMPPPPPPTKQHALGRLAHALRGRPNQDKELRRRERDAKRSGVPASSRMDVIDRMDLSGLGTSRTYSLFFCICLVLLTLLSLSVFHHDSPYDACSPHSNRNARKAPVKAFNEMADPAELDSSRSNGSTRPGLSPLAAATMRKMSESAADVQDNGKAGRLESTLSGTSSLSNRSQTAPGGQVPLLGRTTTNASSITSPNSDNASAQGVLDGDVQAERAYRNNKGYATQPSNVSRGRADVTNPMADIWGVSSEPWQDFAAPASGHDARNHSARLSNDGLPSAASSVFDMEAVMTGKPSKTLPDVPARSTPNYNGIPNDNMPKRSKSLIKRIKSARQNPNVPPPSDDTKTVSPDSSEADVSHRRRHQHSPSTPSLPHPPSPGARSPNSSIGRSRTVRTAGASNGYVHSQERSPNGTTSSANLGRSGSIFNRFRGNKTRERDAAEAH